VSTPVSRRGVLATGCAAAVAGVVACGKDAPPSNGAIIALSKLPRGGGYVDGGREVVVTRSHDGTIHAFSAICTHRGCTVRDVENGTINCPCHGSQFNAETGAVVHGPAVRPLPKVSVVVRKGSVYRA
jgi:Rieske Fe-S protein